VKQFIKYGNFLETCVIIPIYYGNRHTFIMHAERRAEVICPDCKHAFSLQDQVGAVGESFSILGLQSDKASANAEQAAIRRLASASAQLSPVPCPKCGSFHPAMKPILRWLLMQRILFAVMGLVVILAVGAMLLFLKVGMGERAALGGVGLVAVGFLAFRYVKDLRLCPVQVEDLPVVAQRPEMRVALRAPGGEWNWLDA
jgi:hypothetical protein